MGNVQCACGFDIHFRFPVFWQCTVIFSLRFFGFCQYIHVRKSFSQVFFAPGLFSLSWGDVQEEFWPYSATDWPRSGSCGFGSLADLFLRSHQPHFKVETCHKCRGLVGEDVERELPTGCGCLVEGWRFSVRFHVPRSCENSVLKQQLCSFPASAI